MTCEDMSLDQAIPCVYCNEFGESTIFFISPVTGVVMCERCVKALAITLNEITRVASKKEVVH